MGIHIHMAGWLDGRLAILCLFKNISVEKGQCESEMWKAVTMQWNTDYGSNE